MAVVTQDRPKGKSLKPLRALAPYLAPHWRVLAAALAALLVAAAAQLALPIALRFLIDQGLAVRDAATINRYFVVFLGAAVVFGGFAALRFYLVSWLGERVVADLRSKVYAKVIRMDPAFFEVTRTGEVLSRLTADTTLVQSISGVG
ncbi:MAG TPA: ABC transporter transmembrane domain-containing protein, partial [Gammaproteobacteria bacterium]|nr:ABC transporter transmembrane domain-containing protein [Gammaproteobacteria bacterium]